MHANATKPTHTALMFTSALDRLRGLPGSEPIDTLDQQSPIRRLNELTDSMSGADSQQSVEIGTFQQTVPRSPLRTPAHAARRCNNPTVCLWRALPSTSAHFASG
jgi:hypothetical protein